MRPIWSGMISFGLVNISVRLLAATEEHSLEFDYLNKKDLSPIHYQRIDETTGEQVAYRDIVRGYKYRNGDYVVLGEDDFKRANVKKAQTIELTDFVRLQDIDVKLFEKPYYLEPAKESRNVYALLREALKKTDKAGVGTFVLKTREHLCALKPENDAIVLLQMRFAGELRGTGELDLPGDVPLSDTEMELAAQLIRQASRPFHPEDYKDTYTEELKKIIHDKVRGKERPVKAGEPLPTAVSELLAKLKNSLEYAGSRKK